MTLAKKIFIFFLFGIAGGIFGSQILWPYLLKHFFNVPAYSLPETIVVFQKKDTKEIEKVKDLLRSEKEKTIQEIIPALVPIKVQNPDKKSVIIAGFIISSDGFILLPQNYLGSDSKIFAIINEKIYKPMIVKKDPALNLAILKIDETNLKTMPFISEEKNISLGKEVFLFSFNDKMELFFQTEEIAFYEPKTKEVRLKSLFKNNPSFVVFDQEGNFLGLGISDSEGNIILPSFQKIKEFIGF